MNPYRWLNAPPEAAQRIKARRLAMFKLRACKNYNAPHGSSFTPPKSDGAGAAVVAPKRPPQSPSGAMGARIESQYRAVQAAQVIAKPSEGVADGLLKAAGYGGLPPSPAPPGDEGQQSFPSKTPRPPASPRGAGAASKRPRSDGVAPQYPAPLTGAKQGEAE